MFYQKTKKNISILLIVVAVFIVSSKPRVAGQTADDLQKQKDAKQLELLGLEKKINDYQSQIKDAQSQTNTLKNQIKLLNLQIVETQAQIEVTNDKIDAANLEIADVTEKIVQSEKNIAKEKRILKQLVSEINDLDQRTPLEIALENDNFSEFLDEIQYVSNVQEQTHEALVKVKQLQADLEVRQADLKSEKSNLDNLSAQLAITQAGLSGQQKAKQQLLDQTRGQEKAYQKLLTVSEAQEKDLQDEINNLDNQISEKLGNTKLKAIHGLLAWPMQGTLTQGYGNTGFTSLGYTFHNGIDIAAPAGMPIYAAGDGTVIATGAGEGAYGNWVAIKHDTGKFTSSAIITLYGHMSSFRMHTGQLVKLGDLVGFEGNTGNTTRILYGAHRGYHLHFTVFDARGFGVSPGAYTKIYGAYDVPYGATYNPLDFL